MSEHRRSFKLFRWKISESASSTAGSWQQWHGSRTDKKASWADLDEDNWGSQSSRHRKPGAWRKPKQPKIRKPGDSETFAIIFDEDSDASDASIFGLRIKSHEFDDTDFDADAAYYDRQEKAVAEWEEVHRWRDANFLLNDFDFAHVFEDFEDAQCQAGKLVATACSLEACHDIWQQDNFPSLSSLRPSTIPSLRQPGKDAESIDGGSRKERLLEPMVQLMTDCRVGRTRNPSATEEELSISVRRTATRVTEATDIPTLYRANVTVTGQVWKQDSLRGNRLHRIRSA